MSFNFGAAKTAAPAGSTFSFGAASSTTGAGGGGFSFGGAPTSQAPAPAFSLGGAAASTAPAAGGFPFGAKTTAAPTAATTGFSFGGAPAASAAPAAGGFSFGAKPAATIAPATTAASGGFSFGSSAATAKPVAAAAPTAGGFSFGNKTTTVAPVAPTATASTGFSFGGGSTAAAVKPTATPGAGFFGAPASTQVTAAVKPSLNFGTPALSTSATAAATGLSFSTPAASSAGAATGFKLGSTATTSVIATTAATSSLATTALKQVSYKSLEETIDKWLHDLNEQEKSFLNQASQVNMWDKQLIENGEKISETHNEVERVKAEQLRLDRELDFILSQQEELEELLTPIEAQLNTHQMVSYSQHADVERERTYSLAENIDSQLKHMMQSLNEIIEHVNTSNTTSKNQKDETMSQIAKILNAHMDSLQWIDQNTNKLQQRVKEVSHAMDGQRKDQERSFQFNCD